MGQGIVPEEQHNGQMMTDRESAIANTQDGVQEFYDELAKMVSDHRRSGQVRLTAIVDRGRITKVEIQKNAAVHVLSEEGKTRKR